MDPSYLLGTWSIDRDLLDRRTGHRGAFLGTLSVETSSEGFDWRESGRLTWGARPSPAYRHLALRKVAGQWWMHFSDGRPFHPWLVGKSLEHPCGADLYRGRITAPPPGTDDGGEWTSLQIVWDVSGPEKDQQIISRLRRIAPVERG